MISINAGPKLKYVGFNQQWTNTKVTPVLFKNVIKPDCKSITSVWFFTLQAWNYIMEAMVFVAPTLGLGAPSKVSH